MLELARNGKWAWLFKALMNNQETILAIFAKHGVMGVGGGLPGLTQSVGAVGPNTASWESDASMSAGEAEDLP
jgi:hypothetical protein